MDELLRSPWLDDRNDGAPGCAYIIEEGEDRRCCGEALRPGSSYCPPHHALCHVACGTIGRGPSVFAKSKRLRVRSADAARATAAGRLAAF